MRKTLVLVGGPGCVDAWPGLVSCFLSPLPSGGHDLGGQVGVLAEELDFLVGEGEVVVSSGEFLLEVSLGRSRRVLVRRGPLPLEAEARPLLPRLSPRINC